MTVKTSPAAISAVIFGAAILLLTPFAAAVADDDDRPFRIVSVSGVGEVQVRPDTASINAGIVSDGADAKSTLAANSKTMGDLFKSLKNMGIADRDIQTRNFSIAPRYARQLTRPQPGQPAAQQNVIIGYRVTNTVAVRVRDLARLGARALLAGFLATLVNACLASMVL